MVATDKNNALVYTIEDRCRVCYTCVRECPAKAIQIIKGQAQIINERCIGCGNCTRVCSQDAKAYRKSIHKVRTLLEKKKNVAAVVAPSFPAEFKELNDHKQLVGMIRALGFDKVVEVAFGADLVAREYQKLLKNDTSKNYISSDCPAIVKYILLYHPDIAGSLAPIDSPMVAISKVVKKMHGDDTPVVFIGPCIAKKEESDLIDEVLTFTELRELLKEKGINPENASLSDFDRPAGSKGAIFPVSRGLVQTAGLEDDIIKGNVIVAEGRNSFQEAIKEFENGVIKSQHLELLCCEGCVMGPGMSMNGKLYERNACVSNYVREKIAHFDNKVWESDIEHFHKLDFTAQHKVKDQRIPDPSREEIIKVLKRIGKEKPEDHLNCGACGYDTCEEHAIAIINGLAETEMCLPYTIDKLHTSIGQLAVSNDKLVTIQQTLKQTEKLAHMGQLSAGIAHELNNPLGVIIMYSNLLLEECPKDSQMKKDLKLIVEQGDRCKKIVGGLLNFARRNQVNREETEINQLIRQSVSSVIFPSNVKIDIVSNSENIPASLDKEQMIQAFTNLFKNAFEAMQDRGSLKIEINENNDTINISVKDSGHGIDKENLDKIFEPFFTTKEIGIGTGLGLATTYGIVKMHKGNITVESNTDPGQGETGTKFTITLPKYVK